MSSNARFFDEQLNQSEIKARIAAAYFVSWARVLLPSIRKNNGKMAYVDLYAGPGRYEDGSASTPLLVLKAIIDKPPLAAHVVTYFNDADGNKSATLQSEIGQLSGIRTLRYVPRVSSAEVDAEVANFFVQNPLLPSFTFIDPWGYKGLSLKILHGVIKDWGCDCLFFFNYRRINAGISNSSFRRHMVALFGRDRFFELQVSVQNKRGDQRERMVLNALKEALTDGGGNHVLSFRFQNSSRRTTHHLIFVSKHRRGYDIMKGIMARAGYTRTDGVPSFTHCPADKKMRRMDLGHPLIELRSSLLQTFSGRRLSTKEIYEQHEEGSVFLPRHYKQVLLELEEDAIIEVISATNRKRRVGTFADHLVVRFPEVPRHE